MSQQFVKGRQNNHLTWVMVDATDFATPESAVSAATKIKIYGKLRGAAGVNFVSSGAGSLTNDINHVGASATGIYTIALAKADLSDASAAWYDQYIINLSATGCAFQTLVVDGGIDASAISGFQSRLSDILSYLVALSGLDSDIQSAVAVGNSRILLAQSFASDAASAAQQGNSRVLLAQSFASDAASAAAQGNSRVLLVQSRLSDLDSRLASEFSDVYSLLSDLQSDFQSRVPKRVATDSQLSDVESNLRSLVIAGIMLDASTMSDLRSAVLSLSAAISDAHSAATQASSRALVAASFASDAQSQAAVASSRALLIQSQASDIYSLLSDVASDVTVVSGVVSDIYSLVAAGAPLGASDLSDLRSAITANGVLLAGADPTGVPAVGATLAAKVDWIAALSRNKVQQTATVQSLRNDADAADIASAAVSDDGVTFERGKFA